MRQDLRVQNLYFHHCEPDVCGEEKWYIPQGPQELNQLKVEGAAISKVRRPGSDMASEGGCTYYWLSCSNGNHLQGVTIAISSKL